MDQSSRRVTFSGIGVSLVADRWDAQGDGQKGTVLLLHGGGQTRHSWQRTGEDLAVRGWNAIALDMRGHGESEWAPDGDYSTGALVADLQAVVDSLDEKPVLVGASMGGTTALVAQGEDPELARGLALVDITPRSEPDGISEITEFMHAGLKGFATLEEAAAAVTAYNPHRSRPARPDGLRKNLRRRGDRWYWHWDPQLLSARQSSREAQERQSRRARDAARRITVPTLLVRGKQSRVVSAEGVREFLELIPSARFVDVEGAGHMVAGDDNDLFGERLLEFLDDAVLLAR